MSANRLHKTDVDTMVTVVDCKDAVVQVLFSYPDDTIDAMMDCFDEELDYIFQVFDRKMRYSLLADELVEILRDNTEPSCIAVIVRIFLRHGIKAIRMQNDFGSMEWGEVLRGYVKLGPIFVAMGEGQQYKEEEDVLNAAESLCRIRLSGNTTLQSKMHSRLHRIS